MAVWEVDGKVEGAQDSENAAWVVERTRSRRSFDRRHGAHPVREREIDLGGQERRLGPRIPERFSDFAGKQPGELVGAAFHDRCEASKHLLAGGQSRVAPCGKGAPCACNGAVYGGLIRHGERPDLVPRVCGRDAP